MRRIDISASAIWVNVFSRAHDREYLTNQFTSFCLILRFYKFIDKRFDTTCFIKHHCGMQRMYITDAPDIRQTINCLRRLNIHSFHCITKFGRYPYLTDILDTSVLHFNNSFFAYDSFGICFSVDLVIIKAYGNYTGFVKSAQFALFRDTVAVCIDPDKKITKYLIISSDLAIAVLIILCKRFKAVFSKSPIIQNKKVAENFVAVVDLAVAVFVYRENTICSCPVYPLSKTVGVQVEISAVFFGLKVIIVAIKVDNERIIGYRSCICSIAPRTCKTVRETKSAAGENWQTPSGYNKSTATVGTATAV